MTRKHHLQYRPRIRSGHWTFPTVFSEPKESEYDVNCYTDGSKINEQVGAGIVVKSSPSKGGLNHNEAFHLDKHNTVLQAEVFAVGKTATFLLDNKIEGSKVMINCDSVTVMPLLGRLTQQ